MLENSKAQFWVAFSILFSLMNSFIRMALTTIYIDDAWVYISTSDLSLISGHMSLTTYFSFLFGYLISFQVFCVWNETLDSEPSTKVLMLSLYSLSHTWHLYSIS